MHTLTKHTHSHSHTGEDVKDTRIHNPTNPDAGDNVGSEIICCIASFPLHAGYDGSPEEVHTASLLY